MGTARRDSLPAQSYEKLASTYDSKRFSGAHGRFLADADRRILRTMLAVAAPNRLLDVPTGTGRVIEYLEGMRIQVIGLDYTSEMLAEARKRVNGHPHLLRGNAGQLPFADAAFDCVVSLRFFHLFESSERQVFAREFQRVISPGGHLVISFTNGWYGGGINWAKRAIGRPTVRFEHHGEVRRLFPGFRIRRRMGNFLPMQWRLQVLPPAASLVRRATEVFPLNRLCWERFYLLERTSDR